MEPPDESASTKLKNLTVDPMGFAGDVPEFRIETNIGMSAVPSPVRSALRLPEVALIELPVCVICTVSAIAVEDAATAAAVEPAIHLNLEWECGARLSESVFIIQFFGFCF